MQTLRTKIALITCSILTILIFSVSCTKDPAIPVLTDYPDDIGKIFSNKCSTPGCHNNASYEGAANLNLTSFCK